MINKENNVNLQLTISKQDADKLNDIIKALNTKTKSYTKSQAISYLINHFENVENKPLHGTPKKAKATTDDLEKASSPKEQTETQELNELKKQLNDIIKANQKDSVKTPRETMIETLSKERQKIIYKYDSLDLPKNYIYKGVQINEIQAKELSNYDANPKRD